MGRSPSPAVPVRVRPSSSACRPPVGVDPLDFVEVGTAGADAAPRRIFPRFAKQKRGRFSGSGPPKISILYVTDPAPLRPPDWSRFCSRQPCESVYHG